MVRELHRVIGTEAREQCLAVDGRHPDVVIACVGGGSNAIGIFSGFADTDAELVGVEPAGGAAIGHGVPGIVHGSTSFLLQDDHGQVQEAESISAGLDYPGVGPEHAHLADIGRARYESVTDAEVLDAFQLLSRTEGIIPALESAHALAWVSRARQELAGKTVLLNLSGRGDKDVAQVAEILGGAVMGTPREAPARAARRRPQAARSPTSPAGCATTGSTSSGPTTTPAPTPSRSASPSPTRSWTAPPSRPPPTPRCATAPRRRASSPRSGASTSASR